MIHNDTDTTTNNSMASGKNSSGHETIVRSSFEIADAPNNGRAGNHNESHAGAHDAAVSIEEQYQKEREAAKIRHWKESEHAAGCVEPTWGDELESYRVKRLMRRNRRDRLNDTGDGGVAWRVREGMQDVCENVTESCTSCCQEEIDPGCGCVYLSAVVCSRLGAGRIGNMAVLKERYVLVEADDDDEEKNGIEDDEKNGNSDKKNDFTKLEGEDTEDGFRDEEEALHQRKSGLSKTTNSSKKTILVRKREIQLIVGPFWPMLLFITYPLIFGVSFFAAWHGLHNRPLYMKLIWALLTGQLIRSLFNTGFRDPGILKRHKNPPPVENDNADSDDSDGGRRRRRIGFRWGNDTGPWRWSDQAQSYRPRNSMYDPDCRVVVEEFDHTCPWTGTAIGKRNMYSFQWFVGLVFVCLIMDIFLITGAIPR